MENIMTESVGVQQAGTTDFKLLDEPGLQGWRRVKGAVQFSVSSKSKLTVIQSRDRGEKGEAVGAVSDKEPGTIKLKYNRIAPLTLAMQMMGNVSKVSRAAGSATNQAIRLRHDQYIDVGHMRLDPSREFLVTNADGTATYALATDYLVDWELGSIMALSSGAVDDLEDCKWSGEWEAWEAVQVDGGLKNQFRVGVRLGSDNDVTGEAGYVEYPEVILGADGDFDWLSDKPAEVSLTGTVVKPVGAPSGKVLARIRRPA